MQAAHFLATGRRLLPTGPWDEDLLWLFGPAALEADRDEHPQPVSTGFEVGGYYTLRRDDSWAMIRCHTYRDRPSHVDPLHLDLWWRGLNILRDCGTYQYYIPGRGDIERYFKSIAGHNTVEIDGRDPIELVSRFLWLPWPKARVRHYEPRNVAAKWFEGEARGLRTVRDWACGTVGLWWGWPAMSGSLSTTCLRVSGIAQLCGGTSWTRRVGRATGRAFHCAVDIRREARFGVRG